MMFLERDTSGLTEEQLSDPSFDLGSLPFHPWVDSSEFHRPEPTSVFLARRFWDAEACVNTVRWSSSCALISPEYIEFATQPKFAVNFGGKRSALQAPSAGGEYELLTTPQHVTLDVVDAPVAIETFFSDVFLPDEGWCARYRKTRLPMMLELTIAGWRYLALKRPVDCRVTIQDVAAALTTYVESQGLTGTGPGPDGLSHLASTLHAQWIAQDEKSCALINTKRKVKGNRVTKPK
jgi:hypothetical protein